MEFKIEEWPIEKLVPYAKNPRKNDDAVPKMVGEISKFGFRYPFLVKKDGTIIDGHLRYKAAQQLQIKTVPVSIIDDLSEAGIKALRIAINHSASWADWDNELLVVELEELKDCEIDLVEIGIDDILPDSPDIDFDNFFTAEASDRKPKKKMVKCPKCGEEFEI